MTTIAHWDGPPLEAWRAWHPREAAARLAGVDIPWCVVGGWSIDLWLGRETRPHGDLEVEVLRADYGRVRAHLGAFEFRCVGDGEARALPAGADPPADRYQNWIFDASANEWRMDVMLASGDADTWVFRRDKSIRAPRATMIESRDGIPFLKPHGTLLYKAKRAEAKDQSDFAACAPLLDDADRAWLIGTLDRLHPGHPWLAALRNR